MADKKISELTSAGALTGTEELPITQSGSTVKTTAQTIANLGGGGHQSTLYDATADTPSLVAHGGATPAVTVQVGVDFTSHGKLSAPPDGFTFNGHTFPTWFDPTVTPESWSTAGWFAFDFDGSAHLWVAQHWGFGPTQGASLTVGSAGTVFDLFTRSGQVIPIFNVWDTDGTTLRWHQGDPGSPNSTNWVSANQLDNVFIYADNGDAEVIVQHVGGARVFLELETGDRSGAVWDHATLLGKVTVFGGDAGLIVITQSAGQTDTPFELRDSGSNPLFRFTQTGAAEFREQSDPAAAAATLLRLYAKDTGGVSRLYLRDDTAVKQLAVTTDIPSFATNGIVLGSSAAAGAATTVMRSNDTIAAFDATSPTTQAVGDAAAVGTAAFAARRDHKHAWPSGASFWSSLSGTAGAAVAMNAQSLTSVGAITSSTNTVAATGSTETLDTSVYAVHDATMDQACTFTFSNPAASGTNTTFMLILRGAFTPTLPAAVKWSGGVAPTYTTPSVYVFTTIDAGTNWLGQQVGKAFA